MRSGWLIICNWAQSLDPKRTYLIIIPLIIQVISPNSTPQYLTIIIKLKPKIVPFNIPNQLNINNNNTK